METISYKTIDDTSVNDFYKLPYKIKCRGLIFKKEYNWYYSKKYSLDDIANNGDDCEIIEWEEPEITQEELLQQRIDKALKDIEGYKKMFNLNLFSTALENIEDKLRGEE